MVAKITKICASETSSTLSDIGYLPPQYDDSAPMLSILRSNTVGYTVRGIATKITNDNCCIVCMLVCGMLHIDNVMTMHIKTHGYE